jgi:hypothetical protein
MHWSRSEPSLSELLADPIVMAVMAADRVAPEQLRRDLRKIATMLEQRATCPRRVGAITATPSAQAATRI